MQRLHSTRFRFWRICVASTMLLAALLLSGCETCWNMSFKRMTLTQADTEWKAASNPFGLKLRHQGDLRIALYTCTGHAHPEDAGRLCIQVAMPARNRFQFLDANIIVSGIEGKTAQRVAMGPVEYQRSCKLPKRALPRDCPFSTEEPAAVDPAVLQTVTRVIELPKDSNVLLVQTHRFDPGLEFRGASSGGFKVLAEDRWTTYTSVVPVDRDMASDYQVVLPRMALNGRELPALTVHLHDAREQVCAMPGH